MFISAKIRVTHREFAGKMPSHRYRSNNLPLNSNVISGTILGKNLKNDLFSIYQLLKVKLNNLVYIQQAVHTNFADSMQ